MGRVGRYKTAGLRLSGEARRLLAELRALEAIAAGVPRATNDQVIRRALINRKRNLRAGLRNRGWTGEALSAIQRAATTSGQRDTDHRHDNLSDRLLRAPIIPAIDD